MQPEQPALTVKEFCFRYQVSPRAFYALLERGQAPAILRVGRSVRITTAAAMAWEAARTVQPAPRDPP